MSETVNDLAVRTALRFAAQGYKPERCERRNQKCVTGKGNMS